MHYPFIWLILIATIKKKNGLLLWPVVVNDWSVCFCSQPLLRFLGLFYDENDFILVLVLGAIITV